ncbi:MAG: Ig-like domain-containing protein [Deltaproteobacteria bacterium]|nr:Ig-like domain-containing protein [Deltaproteobacteria bacterium]
MHRHNNPILVTLFVVLAGCGGGNKEPGGAGLQLTLLSPGPNETVAPLFNAQAKVAGGKPPYKVEFLIGEGPMGVVVEAEPYVALLDAEEVGVSPLRLRAKVTDAAGATATTDVLVKVGWGLQVGNAPPKVNLVYPANASEVCGTVQVLAVAQDDGEKAAKVQFHLDGNAVFESTQAPHKWDWPTQDGAKGTHVLKVTATDEQGLLSAASVTVTVKSGKACDLAPSVLVTSPKAQAAVRGSSDVKTLATDDVGVQEVQFFIDGSMIGRDDKTPFEMTWNTDEFVEGPHTLRALATDTTSQQTRDDVTVIVDRTPPTVEIVSPDESTVHDGVFQVEVKASDKGGIFGVRLSLAKDGVVVHKVGALGRGPYRFEVDGKAVVGGEYELLAEARDTVGLTAQASRRIAVGGMNAKACVTNSECASGFCTDGVCCNAECGGKCTACNLPSSVGQCAAIKSAEDVGTCEGRNSCDSQGSCRLKQGEGCKFDADCASGFCTDGFCCESKCADACVVCSNPEKRGQCVPLPALAKDGPMCIAEGSACDGAGVCKTLKGACAANAECASGQCREGSCCSDLSCAPVLSWVGVYTSSAMTWVNGVAAIASTDVVVAGTASAYSFDFDPTPGTVATRFPNFNNAAFVQRLSANGSLVWGHLIGSSNSFGQAQAASVVVKGDDVYVAGTFAGLVDFDPGLLTASLSSVGGLNSWDAFLLKLDGAGAFKWVIPILAGSASTPLIHDVAIGPDGEPVVLGQIPSTVDIDPSPQQTLLSSAQGNTFVAKYSAEGVLRWGRAFTQATQPRSRLAVGPAGEIILAGAFAATVDLDPGEGVESRTSVGAKDAFVTKLSAVGGYVWSRSFGGAGDEFAAATVDGTGNVYVTGGFTGLVKLDPSEANASGTPLPSYSAYVLKYDPAGNYLWSKTLSAESLVSGRNLVPNAAGDGVVVAGIFGGELDFDPGAGSLRIRAAAGIDNFALRLTADGTFVWARAWGAAESSTSVSMGPGPGSTLYFAGSFRGLSFPIDFDPSNNIRIASSNSSANGYVVRWDP